jgi:hypothetical protein
MKRGEKPMRILLSLILACLLMSCKANNNYQPGAKNENLQKYSQVKTFDDLFELANTITFDTSKKAALGYFRSIKFTNDKKMIFFSPGAVAKVFSNSGKFLFNLGRKGGGPGEYLSPFMCDVAGHTAYIFDQGQTSLVLFNLNDGSHIKNIKLKRQYSAMQFVENKLYLFRSDNILKIIFDVMDAASERITEIELPAPGEAEKLKYLGIMFGISSFRNNLVYCFQSDFKINVFSSDLNKTLYRSNYVPSKVNIPPLPGDQNKKYSLHSIHAGISGFAVFNNGLILNSFLQTPDNTSGDTKKRNEMFTLLYDDRGNYLSMFEKWGNLYSDGEFLYEYSNASDKADLNGTLKVYKFKY